MDEVPELVRAAPLNGSVTKNDAFKAKRNERKEMAQLVE
jgi:hypothetical protein